MISGAAILATTPVALAARNQDAERYVQESAAVALRSLGNRDSQQRQQTFHRLMAQFSDMPRIANYVLGRYGSQLNADPALRAEWTRAFQAYAIVAYEHHLERYSGGAIRVTNSIERVAGRDVIVISNIVSIGATRAAPVQWRMLRTGQTWKVVDVSLVVEGNEIWLAQQQQSNFLAELDRNNGDIRALIASVNSLTASMRRSIMAQR